MNSEFMQMCHTWSVGMCLGKNVDVDVNALCRVKWTYKATKTPDSHPDAPVVDQLNAEEKRKWVESLEIVKSLGFEDEKAEKLLSRGFGWGSQAYWQGSKTNEVPEAQLVG